MKNKIEYINKVNDRFINASNHGRGSNWWYPTANTIAYNVKMHAWADVDTLREHLTDRQKEFYNDDILQSYIDDEQDHACEMLVEDIKDNHGLDSHFAGRSGGWIEVKFENELNDVDDSMDKADIDMYYKLAQELEKKETDVAQNIEISHKGYNNYIDSDTYYTDIVDNLQSDDDIATIYRAQIKNITNKLN